MISVLAMLGSGVLCLALSAAVGAGIVTALGWRDSGPVFVPIGFAALLVVSALVIRLPGRAVTLVAILAALALAAALYARSRGFGAGVARGELSVALGAVAILFALGSIPFALEGHLGVLGEGVYTNDHAAQLYWTDWLRNGFGPEPSAVAFGYPTGPQSLTAAVATPLGANLIDAFNGVMLGVSALTALAALGPLRALRPAPRLLGAVLVGLPYLGASYLAQSAFKETVMAMLVVALAVTLTALGRGAPRRAIAGAVVVLAAGSVFAYSVPGLAWFVAGIAIWLVAEAIFGTRVSIDVRRILGALRSRAGLIGVLVALAAVAAAVVLAGPQIASFAERIGSVQSSRGRLASPVWPGEALGVWLEGDFRIVRGEVPLAYPATLLGLAVALLGAVYAFRRRDLGLLSVLLGAAVIYLGSYAFASIYVAAKALAILAPLVMLGGVLALLGPREPERRPLRLARGGLAAVFCIAAILSTLLALRAAPVGLPDRGEDLEALAERIEGEEVLFLGVDRFGSYRLRGTLAQSPGGYFEPSVPARPQKVWQQGDPIDFDSVEPARLDRFRYAITTDAAYRSTPPANWEPIDEEGDWVLWKRSGETETVETLAEGGASGRLLECEPGENGEQAADRIAAEAGGELTAEVAEPGEREATELATPLVASRSGWGRKAPFEAPGTASRAIELEPGSWDISLQYASQTPLTVEVEGERTELPASLSGMYLTEKGGGSFWDVGTIEVGAEPGEGLREAFESAGPADARVRIEVTSAAPSGLAGLAGARRLTWLGDIAATRAGEPQARPLAFSCGTYVDHFDPPAPAEEPDPDAG